MSTITMRPAPVRNFTESAIIASPSSSVVCSAWVTWYSELLATMHTAEVPASIRLRNVSSPSTLPRGRRVDPKATSVLDGQLQLGDGPGEELDVLGVGARPSAFDVVHAEVVELLGDAQLVLDRRRHALDLEAVAQGGVEDLDGAGRQWAGWWSQRSWLMALSDLLGVVRARERRKPPGGGWSCTGEDPCTTK